MSLFCHKLLVVMLHEKQPSFKEINYYVWIIKVLLSKFHLPTSLTDTCVCNRLTRGSHSEIDLSRVPQAAFCVLIKPSSGHLKEVNNPSQLCATVHYLTYWLKSSFRRAIGLVYWKKLDLFWFWFFFWLWNSFPRLTWKVAVSSCSKGCISVIMDLW